MAIALGIDTSNYTTSVALLRADTLLADCRMLLEVKPGERGLRQSEAYYQHSMRLPGMLGALNDIVPAQAVDIIAVSEKPRPVEGSYMPVFSAGINAARILAQATGKPLVLSTHQQGHIAAGLFSCKATMPDVFLCLHVSGGTTDLLKVTRRGAQLLPEHLGGTNDLNAGQFVDRVGVALGLSFPAGPGLEELAFGAQKDVPEIKAWVSGMACSFSGAESAAQRRIMAGDAPEDIAQAVQVCIVQALVQVVQAAARETGIRHVLAVGGVLSNRYIRQELNDNLAQLQITTCFADGKLSSDNAVGIAWLGLREREQNGSSN